MKLSLIILEDIILKMSFKQWIWLIIAVIILIGTIILQTGGYDDWGGMPDVFDNSLNSHFK